VLKFQFPKDMLQWIEAHQGAAAWVQALGAILAIGVALWISRRDTRRRRQAERRRATGLAVLLHTEMVDFRHRLTSAMQATAFPDLKVSLPESLVQHSADLYLLGSAGGALLQMISTLRATNRQIDESQRKYPTTTANIDRILRPGIVDSLRLARDACDEAIAALDKIIETTPFKASKVLRAVLSFIGRAGRGRTS